MEFINEYHKLYEKSKIWEKNMWFGVPSWKLPMDMMIIQELIVKERPEYIIETGTACGGSALFYASICELLGEGQVITIDIEDKTHGNFGNFHWEDRIHFVHGSSTNPMTIEKIYKITGWKDLEKFYYGNGGMVILDSWHTKEHVLNEMELYSGFVHDGYMIVEDTHANGHPVPWEYDNEGPYEAVEEWLEKNNDWEVDYECEKHLLTFNPKGYLKRRVRSIGVDHK